MTYKAAIIALPSWSDSEIMDCDLARLHFAIEAAQAAELNRVKLKVKLAGFKFEEPLKEAGSDEEFNEMAATALANLGAKGTGAHG